MKRIPYFELFSRLNELIETISFKLDAFYDFRHWATIDL